VHGQQDAAVLTRHAKSSPGAAAPAESLRPVITQDTKTAEKAVIFG
jgi:hypothetical protein